MNTTFFIYDLRFKLYLHVSCILHRTLLYCTNKQRPNSRILVYSNQPNIDRKRTKILNSIQFAWLYGMPQGGWCHVVIPEISVPKRRGKISISFCPRYVSYPQKHRCVTASTKFYFVDSRQISKLTLFW